MDLQLIYAYCAQDLDGILKPGHPWLSKSGDRWYELNFQILYKHATGARYLRPRQYAAAVCMQALETWAIPYQASDEHPEFTEQDADETSRLMLAKALREYLRHLSESEAAPLLAMDAELQNFAANVAHRYPGMNGIEALQSDPEFQAAPMVTGSASGGNGQTWQSSARARAIEIIKRDGAKDLYPNQEDIADEIAREFRNGGVMGAGGKPLTGSYIKRHALNGISSARGKQLSTPIRRSK